jgi:hypothetical protein
MLWNSSSRGAKLDERKQRILRAFGRPEEGTCVAEMG